MPYISSEAMMVKTREIARVSVAVEVIRRSSGFDIFFVTICTRRD
jgi:hypothetical protein